eukprot:XP_019926560.1 PREDICTED: uncharacterized protein LOC105337152 isoform X2 [Crassostrea gigas]
MEAEKDIKCGFCHLGVEAEPVCGKLHVHHDNKNTSAHQKCMQYSADLVQYKFTSFGGFKIDKVEKEIRRGKRLKCSICKTDRSRQGKWLGATSGCAISNCSKTFHYYCAKRDGVAITKRMEVRYLKENSTIIMYRVFCGPDHYEQFKSNKGALKKQHLVRNCSDEEQGSDDEDNAVHAEPDSLNTQYDDDILMISQLSPEKDMDEEMSTTSEKGDAIRKSARKGKKIELKESVSPIVQNVPDGKQKTKTSPLKEKLSLNKQYSEEDDEIDQISEISGNENNLQNVNDSSDSELEDPFHSKALDVSVRLTDIRGDRRLMNMSRNPSPELEDSDTIEIENNSVLKQKEKAKKSNVEVVNKKTDVNVKKGNQEAATQQRTQVTKNGNKKTRAAENQTFSTPKNNSRGNNKTSNGAQRSITAELHITTSPSSIDEVNTEDQATSNVQGYSSDDEMVQQTNVFKNSCNSRDKSSPQVLPHTPGISSESEWEETAKFPTCALAISSTTKVSPTKKIMITQEAKDSFDVQNVAIWTSSESFSDQLTDDHLPHFMKIITDMVRERQFKKLGNLLTDTSCQLNQMESIKHLLNLPEQIVNKIRSSLLSDVRNEKANGEEVLFMDAKLNTLFLKLNDTVDRTCKIRNRLLPNAKELLGHLYEWTDATTVSTTPLSQSDTETEWKGICDWMNREGWNQCDSYIYPSDEIFLASKENQGIDRLIQNQTAWEGQTLNKKVFFMKEMKDFVNSIMFLQELIRSACADTKHSLIICPVTQNISKESLVPADLGKETVVQIMSAFKPSIKRGTSIIVISLSNQISRRKTAGQTSAPSCENEITVCQVVVPVRSDRKRRAVATKSTTPQQKRKKIIEICFKNHQH